VKTLNRTNVRAEIGFLSYMYRIPYIRILARRKAVARSSHDALVL